MTKLLIVGSTILAQAPLIDDGDNIRSIDAVYPKSVISGYIIPEITLPSDFTPQSYTWDGSKVVAIIPVFDSATAIKTSIARIDADTDYIYGAVLGNKAAEYTSALEDANAYKAASYSGTVPIGVSSWATAKSWTAQQATDDILATAASWKNAQGKIRTIRLTIKEQIRTATTSDDINGYLSSWNNFFTKIKSGLGL